ncbi:MAG: U32 family peptidase [Nanoarchaeota archaeon]|nr:U32 family peptidase [Nanoarchaeota archaeon]MBU4300175.1 U32 family peptidase [Nanoarchaeota archaeon]MBU4451258.1 U32 family peptidase [Nanoarchaeota archaeon]MCG2724380.1 U32 family peptidase [archaeon]
MKKPELLLPVKSMSSLVAALPYADAVYFGAKVFSMRARAGNFTNAEIRKAVEICHKNKIKAYLAVNTVIYPDDEKKLEKLLDAAKMVDAVICWDAAVIQAAKKRNIPIHISTQANVSNAKTAEMYRRLGAIRIVLARECSLKDIKKIKTQTKIEIEVFVHGAMCVSISGRCYLSSYLYGKSANCGDCIQPCRQEWTLTNEDKKELVCDGKYLLSAKDLCMIEHIPELIKAGIDAFKVEGRLRDARYTETAGRCYREAIDSFTKEKAIKWKKELQSVYNRGFSTGFYFKKPTDFTYDLSNSQATSKKVHVGIITNYFPKISVASIKVFSGIIKVGDKIIIEGKTTYLMQKIESIETNGKIKDKILKGEASGIKVKERVRKNDSVYCIRE